jgi:predicted hydrocarbon binding protein
MDLKTNAWIKELLKSLDDHADEETKMQVMGQCGKNCPFSRMPVEKILSIREAADSEEAFLAEVEREWFLKKEGGLWYVILEECFCPLVKENLRDVTKTLCYCTLGAMKYKFSTALQRDVNVVMEKTILAGDDECRFRIEI